MNPELFVVIEKLSNGTALQFLSQKEYEMVITHFGSSDLIYAKSSSFMRQHMKRT